MVRCWRDRRRHLCSKGPFWALCSEWLGAASAGGRPGADQRAWQPFSFFFNYLIGWIQAETGSFPLALMPIALVATIGTVRPGDRPSSSRTVA